MKLWTLQPLSILKEIEETGTYRCKKELSYNLSKQDSLDQQYHWLMNHMEKRIGKRPEGVEYPIWSWHTWEGERRCPDTNSAAFLKRTEDKVLLTLEIPDSQVVLTDFNGWQTVLSGGFLTNETDPKKLDELEDYIDGLDEEELDAAIEKSWETVFDVTRISSSDMEWGYFIQATFWELKKEYIVEQRVIPKEG